MSLKKDHDNLFVVHADIEAPSCDPAALEYWSGLQP